MKFGILLGICIYSVFILAVTYLISVRYIFIQKRLLIYIYFASFLVLIVWGVSNLIPSAKNIISIIASVVSLVFIIQNTRILLKMASIDYLTGTYNRRYLDCYLVELAHKKKRPTSCIMIDIDEFKQVNDRYGHYTGDEVLKATSILLHQSLKLSKNKGFIARCGGDEFYVILYTNSQIELGQAVCNIKTSIEKYNLSVTTSHKISCSMGYDVYDTYRWPEIKNFENHVDKLMYQNKTQRKILRANKIK